MVFLASQNDWPAGRNRFYSRESRLKVVRRKNNAEQVRDLARQRMERLFEMAMQEHADHPERSDRYVQIARKISTRIRIRMPSKYKGRFCKNCGCYLSAADRRVRLYQGIVHVTCLKCGRQSRIPYKNKQI
jgi:ribonuclease P protein subunit RPR2